MTEEINSSFCKKKEVMKPNQKTVKLKIIFVTEIYLLYLKKNLNFVFKISKTLPFVLSIYDFVVSIILSPLLYFGIIRTTTGQ